MKTFSAFTASDKLLGPVWNGSFSVGISKEDRSYGLHTSYIVWNRGIHLPVPEKRNRFLHRARELKHPIRAKSFRGCSSSGRQSASIFFFISDQAPSCCLLDPVACPRLAIDWFGEKQARGSNTLRRTLELEKGKDG